MGSFENGVSRFSRLLPAQLNAAPAFVTIVPNSGLAITFDQGNGVSRSPSRTTMYSRPSGVNPPSPLPSTWRGGSSGVSAGDGPLDATGGVTLCSSNSHGAGRAI